jgi:TfoX/Sxy family transcriptional regulator of competence genes
VQIPKPSQHDREYFHALLPDAPEIEVKPMFGNLGAFVNGNMFCGLFGADIGVRLTDPDAPARLIQAGGGPFGPAERPMGGYVSLPADLRDEPDQPTAREWVRLAYQQVGALAPKAPKSRTARSVQPRA